MEKVTLRLAKIAERQALEDLQRRASLAWGDYRAELLAHPDAIVLPAAQVEEGQVVLAEVARSFVGFSAVLPRDDGDVELDGLFVEPSSWRTGIGRMLVADACRRAASEGAGFLHVIANPRAVPFYQACGFERLSETQTRFGVAPTMRRKLFRG
jgi:GNAT superfamily N-acetyltransferase